MSIINLILILIVIFAGPALAKDATCEEQMTVDERYEEVLENKELSRKDRNVAITHLLNDAFSPYLMSIYNDVMSLAPVNIRMRSAGLDGTEETLFINPYAHGREFGYDGTFLYRYKFNQDRPKDAFQAPANEHNSDVMMRLARSAYIVARFLRTDVRLYKRQTLPESNFLRKQCTFTKDDLDDQMYYAFVSVLQAAAQLTADPVRGRTPDQVLREVMAQKGKLPSLVVQMSIMMRPTLLGPQGHFAYVPNPIEFNDKGDLVFTAKFRAIQKFHRDEFARSHPGKFEIGHGCPVGHGRAGADKPSLQYFLDAIMHVYGALK